VSHIPTELRWEIWERDNFQCVICGSRRHLTIDHIIPVSAGGKTKKSNLQTLCQTCNSAKGISLLLNSKPASEATDRLGKFENITHDLMSISQAAKALDKPEVSVYQWIEKGEITTVELEGALFIPTAQVKRKIRAKYDTPKRLERNRLIQEYRKAHPELSFKEIGEVFGISESRAWRIVYGNKKKEDSHDKAMLS
jgi:hypothetical protein